MLCRERDSVGPSIARIPVEYGRQEHYEIIHSRETSSVCHSRIACTDVSPDIIETVRSSPGPWNGHSALRDARVSMSPIDADDTVAFLTSSPYSWGIGSSNPEIRHREGLPLLPRTGIVVGPMREAGVAQSTTITTTGDVI